MMFCIRRSTKEELNECDHLYKIIRFCPNEPEHYSGTTEKFIRAFKTENVKHWSYKLPKDKNDAHTCVWWTFGIDFRQYLQNYDAHKKMYVQPQNQCEVSDLVFFKNI